MSEYQDLKQAIGDVDPDKVKEWIVDHENRLDNLLEQGDMENLKRELQILIQQMGRAKRDFVPKSSDMVIWNLGEMSGYTAGMLYMYNRIYQIRSIREELLDSDALKILETIDSYPDLVLHSKVAEDLNIPYSVLTRLMRPLLRERMVTAYGWGKNCRYTVGKKGKNYIAYLRRGTPGPEKEYEK